MIALASGTQVFAWIATLWGSRPIHRPDAFHPGLFLRLRKRRHDRRHGGDHALRLAGARHQLRGRAFHHVLIGGAVFPLPGRALLLDAQVHRPMANENWGRIGFGLIFVGFNVTFIPMYVIGLLGMRRRVFTYPEELGVGMPSISSPPWALIRWGPGLQWF
jgi:cytochrome c oxidase subunit I+III